VSTAFFKNKDNNLIPVPNPSTPAGQLIPSLSPEVFKKPISLKAKGSQLVSHQLEFHKRITFRLVKPNLQTLDPTAEIFRIRRQLKEAFL